MFWGTNTGSAPLPPGPVSFPQRPGGRKGGSPSCVSHRVCSSPSSLSKSTENISGGGGISNNNKRGLGAGSRSRGAPQAPQKAGPPTCRRGRRCAPRRPCGRGSATGCPAPAAASGSAALFRGERGHSGRGPHVSPGGRAPERPRAEVGTLLLTRRRRALTGGRQGQGQTEAGCEGDLMRFLKGRVNHSPGAGPATAAELGEATALGADPQCLLPAPSRALVLAFLTPRP